MNNESLDALLLLLAPDRELAAREYRGLHARLVRFFEWNNASDPHALADEAFDRCGRHAAEQTQDPIRSVSSFLQGIAKNLLREETRKEQRKAEAARAFAESVQPKYATADTLEDILSECLQHLPHDKRGLIMDYYLFSGGDKIKHHTQTAKNLGISLNTLRNRVMRIRIELEACIRTKM